MERHNSAVCLVVLAIILLGSLTSANSSVHPSHCLYNSLSSFASTKSSQKVECSETMFKLLPGKHMLDRELTVKDIFKVEVHAESDVSNPTTVICNGSERFTFENVSNLHIKDVVFVGCTGIQILRIENLTIENCQFQGPAAEAADSAVTLCQISTAQIIGTSFTSYDNVKNGVLSVHGNSSVFVTRSKFQGNVATISGGGIHVNGSHVTIDGSVFSGNNVTTSEPTTSLIGNGGSIYAFSSVVTISGSTFVENTAAGYGGGSIYAFLYTYIKITNSTFRDNAVLESGYYGGAFFLSTWSQGYVYNCTFTGNKALNPYYATGGAVFVYTNSNCTIKGSTFRRNTAIKNGGGIDVWFHNTVSLEDNEFIENSAKNYGGGVSIRYYNNAYIGYSNFIRNKANQFDGGGLLVMENYASTIDGCTFRDNIAQQDGGGANFYRYGNLTIIGCTFQNNTAERNGGGLYTFFGNWSIKHSTLQMNNASSGNGRCIYSKYNHATNIDKTTQNSISRDPGCFYDEPL